ncbi:hypothetical protein CSUB01_04666 [Colletotrichum sublineola]|uniref:DUF6603 domain-containing protein n=1 Tax=Colletotrichum sublineola TaxID=1173701 RepID=A0A066X4C7_COLSU|nr:hypothetical protein CSUB01_04666 [Colletotrichum sublineola]
MFTRSLSAASDKPSLTVAGIVRHGDSEGMKYFAGGLIVSYVSYQFMATGFYGTVPPDVRGRPSFTSVFILAKLDGPLVSLNFAEISGPTGGLGYNSSARVPMIKEVVTYPLVAPADFKDANRALDALKTLTNLDKGGWFSPRDKRFWAAMASRWMPSRWCRSTQYCWCSSGAGAHQARARQAWHGPYRRPDYGLLKVKAHLALGSYILAPECHLTGSIALVHWFDGPHADKSRVGDFVFTLGGYQEGMKVPFGWLNQLRVGISWGMSKSLSISGQAYFTVTPKVCMPGVRLYASFSVGPIAEWFDAFSDFLINYKPFHFVGHVRIAMGVSFDINFLFTHTHISVELGADLTLWAPPLAGTVHVDLWVASFSIDFGATQQAAEDIDFYCFYLLVLPASQRVAAKLTPNDEMKRPEPRCPDSEGHNFVVTSGLVNADEKPG